MRKLINGIGIDSDLIKASQKEIIKEEPRDKCFLEDNFFKRVKKRLFQFIKFSSKAFDNKC